VFNPAGHTMCIMDQCDTIPIIETSGATLKEVYRNCLETNTPAMVPSNHYSDHRGHSFFDVFPEVLQGGQVNYTVQHPGIIKAWHRHEKQTDFWCALHGAIRICIMSVQETGERTEATQRWVSDLDENLPAVIVIPPMLWHGAMALGDQSAGLLYYVTEQYNPDEPDEQRQPHDWLWNPWSAKHR